MRQLWIWLALMGSPAQADPCGLVPPMRLLVNNERPIERSGVQRTWVFHRDGVQTIAIRPGFEGNASEFGMLVPLPAVPSLHKIPDGMFEQLELALAPPKVQLEVRQQSQVLSKDFLSRLPTGRSYQSAVGLAAGVTGSGGSKQQDPHWIEVLSEEAIGSYEVAILEAGSPLALRRWMDAHEYAYPDGMEPVVAGYVERGWVFAAVKARLSTKSGVDPVAGQRSVNTRVPDDAPFSGFVQGMAFRFAIDEPVVPMRLSTFNGAELHNRMFILSDAPVRIQELPPQLVHRQLSGQALRDALEAPLPIQVRGSELLQRLSDGQWREVVSARDRVGRTWAAADRVAADLVAARDGETQLERESWGIELVNISYALGLKGPGADALERAVVHKRFGQGSGLDDLDGMTLTVVDGDFDADVLRSHDLHLEPYAMPENRNVAVPWEAPPDIPLQLWVR